MPITREVITAFDRQGNDILGTRNLAWRKEDNNVVSGSLLTVEATQFCVVKSRGVVLNVHDVGQHQLITPDKPLFGAFVQGFWNNGNTPWVYEFIYVNRSKLRIRNEGIATTKEMAEVLYEVDYYVHVETADGALKLVTHMPFDGNVISVKELAEYAGPAIGQSINQIIQVTPLEEVNEKIAALVETVRVHLSDFLDVYGIVLNDIKVLIRPKDERIRELLALRALGVPDERLGGLYLALRMADQGLISAPNAAVGAPFNIGAAITDLGSIVGGVGSLPRVTPPTVGPVK